jgi:hypothetical protein
MLQACNAVMSERRVLATRLCLRWPEWRAAWRGRCRISSRRFRCLRQPFLIAHVADAHSWMTEWGVQPYFWGRVIYLALYTAGVFLLRSLVWNIATLGIVLGLLSLV